MPSGLPGSNSIRDERPFSPGVATLKENRLRCIFAFDMLGCRNLCTCAFAATIANLPSRKQRRAAIGELDIGAALVAPPAGGEKLFVDYAGDTVPVIVDRLSGETRPAQIFVAVMGASSFTYTKAAWT